MKKVKEGYWSIATQKHLKQYMTDSSGLGQLGNLNLTGKAGRFLGVIRGNKTINNMNKIEQMANSVGITSRIELNRIILPELEKASDKKIELIKDVTGEITGVAEYVFTNTDALEITGGVFENLHPSHVERVSIETMDETKRIPYLKGELIQLLVKQGYKEEDINVAIALQNQFKLIRTLNKSKSQEPIISNEYVWGANHHKIAMAVSSLEIGKRNSLKEIIEVIQKTQGYPIERLPKEAKELILLAKKTGMISPTTIISSRGIQKEFAFSAKIIEDDNIYQDDIMDDVKILLASIRFGENYTQHSTILEPEKFLSKLIDSGYIGPHSANATDYTLLEKKGIVRVVNKTVSGYYGPRTGPCLELIRKDVAQQALKIITSPGYIISSDAEITDFSSMVDTGSYLTPEESRVRLGELPESIKEVDEHCQRLLRGELL